MNTDQIHRKILTDQDLEKIWPEITNIESENVNTIKMKPNVYLKYVSIVLSSEYANDNVKKKLIANLIG